MRSALIKMSFALVLTAFLGLAPAASAVQTEVQRLQSEIKALQNESGKAAQAYTAAYWQLDATRVEIARVDGEIAASQERLAQVNARLSKHAADMYRTGGADYVGVLLSSQDFEEMLLLLEYAQRMGRQDATIITEVEAVQATLTQQRSDLEVLRTQQAEQAAVLKKEADRIDAELKAQQSEYDKLQKALKAALEAEKKRLAATTARVGPNGMVFPVAGPCTYTDTWGAARSGGRTHKGTDIMAREGTPCVAILSGEVRTRDNSLGGKTIWLTADNGWAFYYAHLSSYKVTSGRVQAGQVIGYVGSTGNASASAPHLHFEIHPNGGSAVNPYPYLKQMQ